MTDKQRDLNVAKIIWQQMNTIDKNLVWCMGTKKPIAIKNGLMVEVKGLSFKGLVQIILEPNDTYRVLFLKKKRTLDKALTEICGKRQYQTDIVTVGEYKEVYVDTLMPLLEDVVENRKSA